MDKVMETLQELRNEIADDESLTEAASYLRDTWASNHLKRGRRRRKRGAARYAHLTAE